MFQHLEGAPVEHAPPRLPRLGVGHFPQPVMCEDAHFPTLQYPHHEVFFGLFQRIQPCEFVKVCYLPYLSRLEACSQN